ncbi:WAT1-related protein At3g30340-like [Prosopis cineraria]|uniref:WAT1-related protein At3g30340-like n=1 Tax=Prosopis cineraria TaxID=364024 RepID=UPI0024101F01|nr:WAT1-related protein At3g30340-like [Prosopis cineraria]
MKMVNFEEWKPFVAMMAIDFAFAVVNILLEEVLQEGMNPLVLVTYRLSVACIFLAPIAFFWERNGRPKLTVRILCYLFLSALVGTSLTQYFYLLGIHDTSATFACAFINMVPVVTFIMAFPFGLETVNIKGNRGRAKILGTVVCIGGALLLTLYKGKPLFSYSQSDADRHMVSAVKLASPPRNTGRWTTGVIALVVGTVLWSSWFLLQAKIGKRYPCQYSSTAIMTFFGAIQSSVLSLSTSRNSSMWVLKENMQILTVLFSGMVGSGLCFVGLSWCVKKKGPVFTASFSPLVQIMAAMIDIPILHEPLHVGSLMGSILVMVGLYILLWGKNTETQNQECVTKLYQQDGEIRGQEPQIQQIIVSND